MAITVKANIPTKPDTSNPEATLNIQVAGGNGQEAGGFISVQIASTLVSALNAGACTLTLTQP